MKGPGRRSSVVNIIEKSPGSTGEPFDHRLLDKLELGLIAALGLAAQSDRQAAIDALLEFVVSIPGWERRPLWQLAEAIVDCTRRDEVVLDPFAGSGSRVIAAQRTSWRPRLIEYDSANCDQILRRFQQVTGKEPRLAGTGQTFETVAEASARDRAKDSAEREVA